VSCEGKCLAGLGAVRSAKGSWHADGTNTSRAVSSGLSRWSFIGNSLDGRGRHGDAVTIGFEIDGRLAGDGIDEEEWGLAEG
jgi:hypothetical protein